MLVFRQKSGQPMKIGDAVVFAYIDNGRVRILVDAAETINIKRGDVIERTLALNNFTQIDANTWMRNGVSSSTREALKLCPETK